MLFKWIDTDQKHAVSSVEKFFKKLEYVSSVEKCAGNYYGLRGDHHKAIQYFQRACLLDPSYLSSWTLLGHEYVELKNIPAAIQAYRKAVGQSVFNCI